MYVGHSQPFRFKILHASLPQHVHNSMGIFVLWVYPEKRMFWFPPRETIRLVPRGTDEDSPGHSTL